MDYHSLYDIDDEHVEQGQEPEQEPEQEPGPEPVNHPLIITYSPPFSGPLMSGILQNFMTNEIPMHTTFEERVTNQSFHQQPKFKQVASKDFINSLSVQKVSPELVEKKTTCALCLDELILGEDIIELPCGDKHYFHIKKEECPGIYPWLKDNNTCPMCRHEFPSVEKEIEQGETTRMSRMPRMPRMPDPREIRQIVNQAIEDEEERMLQEALYASLNE